MGRAAWNKLDDDDNDDDDDDDDDVYIYILSRVTIHSMQSAILF